MLKAIDIIGSGLKARYPQAEVTARPESTVVVTSDPVPNEPCGAVPVTSADAEIQTVGYHVIVYLPTRNITASLYVPIAFFDEPGIERSIINHIVSAIERERHELDS